MNTVPWLNEIAELLTPHAQNTGCATLLIAPNGLGAEALLSDILHHQMSAGEYHPDLKWIAPTEKTIGIDVARDIIEFSRMPPSTHTHKHVVIEKADTLTIPAANALLKILEAPTRHTHIWLIVSQLMSILPTIRSRCVQFVCRMPAGQEVENWLAEQGVEQPPFWAQFTHGKPFLARQFSADEKIKRHISSTTQSLNAWISGGLPIGDLSKALSDNAQISLLLMSRVAEDTLKLIHNVPQRCQFKKTATLLSRRFSSLDMSDHWSILEHWHHLYYTWCHQSLAPTRLQWEDALLKWARSPKETQSWTSHSLPLP